MRLHRFAMALVLFGLTLTGLVITRVVMAAPPGAGCPKVDDYTCPPQAKTPCRSIIGRCNDAGCGNPTVHEVYACDGEGGITACEADVSFCSDDKYNGDGDCVESAWTESGYACINMRPLGCDGSWRSGCHSVPQ